jgi:hypothetical protein
VNVGRERCGVGTGWGVKRERGAVSERGVLSPLPVVCVRAHAPSFVTSSEHGERLEGSCSVSVNRGGGLGTRGGVEDSFVVAPLQPEHVGLPFESCWVEDGAVFSSQGLCVHQTKRLDGLQVEWCWGGGEIRYRTFAARTARNPL